MKAVIYARVSTEEQSREGVSLANQLSKCRLQAQLDDMEIVAEVEDAGKSAKSLNRQGIQKIIQMVKHKECNRDLQAGSLDPFRKRFERIGGSSQQTWCGTGICARPLGYE